MTSDLWLWLGAFLVVEIGHNDFQRIVLNERGKKGRAMALASVLAPVEAMKVGVGLAGKLEGGKIRRGCAY